LVVLAPVRTDDTVDAPAAHQASGSVLFESPQPVGLQRMFEHTARSTDRTPLSGSMDSPTVSLGASSHRADESGGGHSAASRPSYDLGTNTITFASPVVQRAAETPSAATPAAASVAGAAPAAAAGHGGGGDVDELVNRLYDPLAARLRAELWLDRERAGVLMDLYR
jgi:hypothetical protein